MRKTRRPDGPRHAFGIIVATVIAVVFIMLIWFHPSHEWAFGSISFGESATPFPLLPILLIGDLFGLGVVTYYTVKL